MLKAILISVSLLAVVAGCASHCKKWEDKKMAMTDPQFFNMAAGANQTEIDISQLALSHTQDPQVKQFAQHMIDDHTQANQKLMVYASSKGASLPTQLDDKHQEMVNSLSTLSGPDFDRAFLQDQVAAHQETIKSFKIEATNGADPDSEKFASEMLPTLKMHLQMARQLQKATPYVQPTM